MRLLIISAIWSIAWNAGTTECSAWEKCGIGSAHNEVTHMRIYCSNKTKSNQTNLFSVFNIVRIWSGREEDVLCNSLSTHSLAVCHFVINSTCFPSIASLFFDYHLNWTPSNKQKTKKKKQQNKKEYPKNKSSSRMNGEEKHIRAKLMEKKKKTIRRRNSKLQSDTQTHTHSGIRSSEYCNPEIHCDHRVGTLDALFHFSALVVLVLLN